MQTKHHFICCLLIFKYKTWSDLCVGTFWKSPAHFNNTVIILITVIILVTILVIRNFHTVTSLLPSADKLYGDADFIFQQDLAPAHTAKGTKSWFDDHGVTVLDWPANSPDLNPIEYLWGIVKRKMRDTRPNNADELKATVKETWASIPPQQCHKLITSMPRQIEAVIKAKGAPTKYRVHIQ